MSDEDDDQEVGYGKPPKQHQFKPGQSGNPKGRPKKPNTFIDALKRELEAEIPVTENGKTRRITGLEAIAKTLKHGALKGDDAKLRMLLPLLAQMKSPPSVFQVLPEDNEVLKHLWDQMEETNCEQDDHEDH